ncbi:MAG: class I SAM-dependent methyltransferase [Alphaproteobacteria bacterium]
MPGLEFDRIIARIHGVSPYEGFDASAHPLDVQGWVGRESVFERLIEEVRPSVIVEVGTWKGASAILMANALKARGLDGAIVCVDTWLGSREHWEMAEWRPMLGLKHGYPTIYYQFLANVVHSGHADTIIPLPCASTVAYRWLGDIGVTADLVYIDASHDQSEVYSDISSYWTLVSPNGVLFGDDFRREWPGVVKAVQFFAGLIGRAPTIEGEKWMFRKRDANAVTPA